MSFAVPSFDNTIIHYDLYDLPSPSTILIVPGFWRDRRHPAMVRLAGLFTSRGYRTAVIDMRGHGQSGAIYGFNLHEHRDVAAVGSDLLRRHSPSSITLVGLSYGGAISIATAALDELPLTSLLLISPVADRSMIIPRINPFTVHRHIAFRQAFASPRFAWNLGGRAVRHPLQDIQRVRVPISFLHVRNDWLVGHQHSVALYQQAHQPKELHILDVPGNYHADRIFSAAPDAVEPILASFLERFTRP